jgi:hypothetical protein
LTEVVATFAVFEAIIIFVLIWQVTHQGKAILDRDRHAHDLHSAARQLEKSRDFYAKKFIRLKRRVDDGEAWRGTD